MSDTGSSSARSIVEIPEEERTPELLGSVLQRLLTLSFAYIDAITAHVVDVYTSERARLVRGADAVRADTVRRMLSGAEIDVDAAGRELGYDLRRWHVGMLLWADPADDRDDPLSRLEAEAAGIATALGSGSAAARSPPVAAVLWAWSGSPGAPAGRGPLRASAGAGSAIGSAPRSASPARARSGFSRSHADALEARRVALRRRPPPGRRSPSTATSSCSRCSAAHPERARRFMLAELGALGADDDAAARLRTTLRVYLEEGRSYVGAARRLGGHENTIKYRVRRCEELLGRSVRESPLALASALLLADSLGLADAQPS